MEGGGGGDGGGGGAGGNNWSNIHDSHMQKRHDEDVVRQLVQISEHGILTHTNECVCVCVHKGEDAAIYRGRYYFWCLFRHKHTLTQIGLSPLSLRFSYLSMH